MAFSNMTSLLFTAKSPHIPSTPKVNKNNLKRFVKVPSCPVNKTTRTYFLLYQIHKEITCEQISAKRGPDSRSVVEANSKAL